jgi:hypothetical protein
MDMLTTAIRAFLMGDQRYGAKLIATSQLCPRAGSSFQGVQFQGNGEHMVCVILSSSGMISSSHDVRPKIATIVSDSDRVLYTSGSTYMMLYRLLELLISQFRVTLHCGCKKYCPLESTCIVPIPVVVGVTSGAWGAATTPSRDWKAAVLWWANRWVAAC